MIKFFRRIRQKLFSKGKFGQYFVYAIGEIILVVIGILIALQVNNWNEEKKAKKIEKELLEELHNEFLMNKLQFEITMKGHKNLVTACNVLIKIFNEGEITEAVMKDLSDYGTQTAYSFSFNPSQSTVKSIINTSSFQLISNDSLQKHLLSWPDLVDDYLEEEHVATKFLNETYFSFLIDNLSLNDISDPRIDPAIWKSLKLENMILHRRNTVEQLTLEVNGKARRIQKVIDDIIRFTDIKN